MHIPRVKLTDYRYNDGRFKTINPNEAIILSHLPTKWKWIARDKSGGLCLYAKKPNKGETCWQYCSWEGGISSLICFTSFPYRTIFKCIKWSDPEPTNIGRLLKENLG